MRVFVFNPTNLFRPHVECPICTEIPRDGIMLQCLNGHNVCSVCKNKMGEDAKCPQGRYVCIYLLIVDNRGIINRFSPKVHLTHLSEFLMT